MIIVVTLMAALLLGTGFFLQQRAASRAPLNDMLRPRLVVHLAHSPQWICGIACMVVGQLLSAFALGRASVSLVEPLLAANLFIALLLAAIVSKQRLCRSELIGCLMLGAGLAAFVVVGNPTIDQMSVAAWRLWISVGGIAALALTLVAISRSRPLADQATMLAGAAGCLAGLQDGFTRSSVLTLENDPAALLRTWQTYAVVGVALIVILLQQSAFEAGPLRRTLPALTVGEPLAGIGFGIVAFGDHLSTAAWALGLEAAGLVAMIAGVYVLANSAMLARAVGEAGTHAGIGTPSC